MVFSFVLSMVVNKVGWTYQKATSEAECYRFLGVGEAERGLSYSSNDDLSSFGACCGRSDG